MTRDTTAPADPTIGETDLSHGLANDLEPISRHFPLFAWIARTGRPDLAVVVGSSDTAAVIRQSLGGGTARCVRLDDIEGIMRFDPGSVDLLILDGGHDLSDIAETRLSGRAIVLVHSEGAEGDHETDDRTRFDLGSGLITMAAGQGMPDRLRPALGPADKGAQATAEMARDLFARLGLAHQHLVGARAEIAELTLERDAAAAMARKTETQGSEIHTVIADLRGRLHVAQSELAKLAERGRASPNKERQKTRHALAACRREFEDAQRQIDALTSSTSWKVTRPLRVLVRLMRR